MMITEPQPETLRILPLGGLGEIGMNCMIFETSSEIIVVDCGVLFSDLENFGVELVIPDFSYLKERKDKVKAVLLTHGHEDHIGAVPFLIKAGIDAPLYASPFTSLMLREKLTEHGLLDQVRLRTFKMGERFQVGEDFCIQTISVNHSIVDAAALVIETPLGRVIHTGDFKVDPTPSIGQELDEKFFKKMGEEGVLLLLSDSTNVERNESSKSDQQVYESLDRLLAAAQGLTIIAMFSSNVGRMKQVFDLARKQGKKIALSGRSMEQNVRLASEAGYIQAAAGVLISLDEIHRFPREKIVVLSTGTQGEYRSALVRVSQGEHSTIQLEEGDQVLMSSRFIPGNEKDVGRMINQLFKQGAEVFYDAIHKIHVSGHATRPELKKMLEWTRPRFFVPVHGEYRHLVRHAELAFETGIKEENILIATNGDLLRVRSDDIEVEDHFENEPRVFIDGSNGNEISKTILKERRKLAETGVVFVLFTIEPDSGAVVAGPEVILRGIANPELESKLVEQVHRYLKRQIKEYQEELFEQKMAPSLEELTETIRVDVRKIAQSIVGKKPVVIPYILDLGKL